MRLSTITISKAEYTHLREQASKFEFLKHLFTESYFEEPPTQDINTIVREFRKTGRYNQDFLKSLRRGLQESTYLSSRKV